MGFYIKYRQEFYKWDLKKKQSQIGPSKKNKKMSWYADEAQSKLQGSGTRSGNLKGLLSTEWSGVSVPASLPLSASS